MTPYQQREGVFVVTCSEAMQELAIRSLRLLPRPDEMAGMPQQMGEGVIGDG